MHARFLSPLACCARSLAKDMESRRIGCVQLLCYRQKLIEDLTGMQEEKSPHFHPVRDHFMLKGRR